LPIGIQPLGRQQAQQASGGESDHQCRRLGRQKASDGGRAQAAAG
jgi:hypothetical protein